MVTFNRAEYTKRTVASLISSGAFDKCDRFIVADNHSTDPDMIEFLNTLRGFQKTFVITRPKNDGWASAVNDGLGLSRASWVFLTNNDVEYENGFMDTLFRTAETEPELGILGVWAHTGHSFVGKNTPYFREMDNVPAVGWLMSKAVMQRVGMLPEHGPCLTKGGNGEDTSYVNRMKELGFKVGVCERDVANHIDGY